MTPLELFEHFKDKYSMKELYENGRVYKNCCQFHSSLPFYGCIIKYENHTNTLNIVESLDYDESSDIINCLGWKKILDIETAERKLSKLLYEVHEYEKLYKNKVEQIRLKKMHNDF